MSEGIYIDHSKAMAAVQNLTQLNTNFEKILEELKANLATQVDAWIGDDQTVYYGQIIPAWDNEVKDCHAALAGLIQVLEGNSQNLRNVSMQNAEAFSSIR